jgi:hypothetical protein
VYASFTSISEFLEILVLLGLLSKYLLETEPFELFSMLIFGYLISQSLASLATFTLNRTYISQKDKRLRANIDAQDELNLLTERAS